jgi:HK97 family phage prohead protease
MSTMPVERHTFHVRFAATRAASGAGRQIVGYAAVFNSPSEPLREFGEVFVEVIAPGAFAESIAVDDIRALTNHDPNFVLGRNKSGTLNLREDSHGLRFQISPPRTQWATDLLESIERGDVNQMSFGFITQKDRWDYSSKLRTRHLLKVKLTDVSVVTFPAYTATTASVGVEAARQRLTPEPQLRTLDPDERWERLQDMLESDMHRRLRRIEAEIDRDDEQRLERIERAIRRDILAGLVNV